MLRQHHALLLYGPAGTGKRSFAEAFAQSLLCTSPGDQNFPCGKCTGCHWFSQGTHPDFRLLTPDALRAETEAAEGSAEETSRGEKKPANQINVEQARELQRFLSLTAHVSGGRRVVLIHPADAMNLSAANALLKMLEEPPSQTVFLLVTSEFRRLLPTIISRCRRHPMPNVAYGEGLAWLQGQGVADGGIFLAQAGGAPVAALALAEAGWKQERQDFLDRLGRLSDPGAILELVTTVQKLSLATVVRWLSTWCYDLIAMRLSGTIRYHLGYEDIIATLSKRAHMDRLLQYQDLLKLATRSVTHPLNPRLFLEQLLLSYSQVIATSSVNVHA